MYHTTHAPARLVLLLLLHAKSREYYSDCRYTLPAAAEGMRP
jgi:hypothetical protein